MQIPKDVQDGIREFYGDDELLRRTAETDQRDARLREELEEDIRDIEEGRSRRCR